MSVNALVEKGILAEQKCGSNFAYTLLEDGLFLQQSIKYYGVRTISVF